MIVRRATTDDIPALIALGYVMHEESDRYRLFDFVEQKCADLARQMIERGIVLVAERPEGIVGMMAGFVAEHWFSTCRYLADVVLYVHPMHRGTRAFLYLIREFENFGIEEGVDEIQCNISAEIYAEATAAVFERFSYRRSMIGMVKNV